ncbi:hypothetical protein QBC34DRAFT_399420 [Podospora aff. communis PSN243]|uniref:C2H2-type domain-containing protein n=1 Tax=Podospora aff. communis PSN243 TaxID=3040156 RepID=A0AAV9GZZ9_9PEZI|nr:hypothetical protein QBC34DRAFT_399420 [Podospora aff. communis PSN243]
MFECGTCGKEFPAGWRARENHYKSTGHLPPAFECDTCDAWFRSNNAKWQHMAVKNHFAWRCRDPDCEQTWPTEEQLKEHEIEDHYLCNKCDRYFSNLNNIRMHLRSRDHIGEQSVQCPFCKTSYTTATGLVHHLEHGFCPSAPFLNRDDIYRYVRSKDPGGLISKKLIGWNGDSDDHYEATAMAWNGAAYECYFCHKAFGRLTALNQHLNSGTHRQNLYDCPKAGCRKDFQTLAAVISHLESESCGAVRFDTVQKNIADIVSGGRAIGFR